jgi:hypothetical protein
MRSKLRLVLVGTACVAIPACGGGGGGSASVPLAVKTAQPATTATAGPAGFTPVTFTIGRTSGTTAQSVRKPAFVPASTTSISVALNGTTPQVFPCTSTGCTGTILAPAGGADTFTFTAIDTQARALATASVTQTIAANGINAIAVTLDGIIAGATLSASPAGLSSAADAASVVSAVAHDVDGDVITGTYAAPLTVSDDDETGSIALNGATLTSDTSTAAIVYTASTATMYGENHLLISAGSPTETTAQHALSFEVGRTFYTFTPNAIVGFAPGATAPTRTIPISPAFQDVRGIACDGSNIEVVDYGGNVVYGITRSATAPLTYTSDIPAPISIVGAGDHLQVPPTRALFYVSNDSANLAPAVVGFEGPVGNAPFALPPNAAAQTSSNDTFTSVQIDRNGNIDAAEGGFFAAHSGYQILAPTLSTTLVAIGVNSSSNVAGATQLAVDNTPVIDPRIYTQELNGAGTHGEISQYDNYASTPTAVSTDNDNAGLFVDASGRVYTSTTPGVFHVYQPGTLADGMSAVVYSLPGQSLAFDSAGYVYAVNASGSISIYPPGSTTVLQTIPGTNYGQPTLGPDTFGTFCQ